MGCSDPREGKKHPPEGCLTAHLTDVTAPRGKPLPKAVAAIEKNGSEHHAWALVFCTECKKAWREENSTQQIKDHYKDTGHRLFINNRRNLVRCVQCEVNHSLLLLPERVSRVFLELREEFVKGYHNNFRDKLS